MNIKANKILWEDIFKKLKSEKRTKMDFLRSIPFFQRLKSHQLEEVSNVLHERIYEPGEYIFEAQQPGASLFLIQEGTVSIEAPLEDEKIVQLALLKDRSFFGELALLDETPRSASAKAVVRTRVWALFRNDLQKLCHSRPDIACEIYKILANMVGERLKSTNKLLNGQEAVKAAS